MQKAKKTISDRLFFISLLTVLLSFQTATMLWAADREDPLVVFKFGLEVEGKLLGFFTSVSGMGSESEVVENEITDPNTGETIIQKTPGLLIWLNVTLRRGLTSSTDIWDWRQMVVDGQIDEARVLCSIIAFDQANLEIARWNLTNAWPSKIVVLDTAQGVDYLIEEVVLVHEGIERVS